MDSLKIIPNIKHLLQTGKEKEAIEIINNNINFVSVYIRDCIHLIKLDTPESNLCLSKIYFILQDYEKSIEYAIKSGDLFVNDRSFYFNALTRRMMKNPKNRDFIINLISNDELDEDLIGYLYDIKEIDLFEKALENSQELLIKFCDVVEHNDNFYKFIINQFKRRFICNYKVITVLIDGLVKYKMVKDIEDLILNLEAQDICLCYKICFYINETHRNISINTENKNIKNILNGSFKDQIFSTFMVKNNLTNFKFLDSLSKSRSPYISIVNAFMNMGTTNDTFYRNNSDVFNGIKEWARYIDISNLGMIHINNVGGADCLCEDTNNKDDNNNKNDNNSKDDTNEDAPESTNDMINDNIKEEYPISKNAKHYKIIKHTNDNCPYFSKNKTACHVFKNYLPSETHTNEGGALQAFGLMNVSSNSEIDTDMLLYFLDAKDLLTEEIAFGTCMGVGLINIGNNKEEHIRNKLFNIVNEDNTIISESGIVGLGLIGCGTMDKQIIEMIQTVREETEFERVQRSCSIAISLLYALTKCESVEISASDKMGSILSLGTSYAGTGNLEIIEKILPYINDGDDDVKRSAVISLGLVCCIDQDLLLKVLEPLAENHNFFVRSGVGLVLGFFYSGTGNNKVCDILEGLMYDNNSLVRQSALIGMGFVLQQTNHHLVKNYKRILKKINKIIIDRLEDTSVKYGAMMSRGIIESGGRNIIFSITNLCNKITLERIVGYVMFMNHWYWYPFMSFISLNMKPTAFFCFDENLQLVDKEMSYTGNYDNYIIKLPDIKRSRVFKPKQTQEEDIIIKASTTIKSGERCTLRQMEECNIEFPGIYFIKKK